VPHSRSFALGGRAVAGLAVAFVGVVAFGFAQDGAASAKRRPPVARGWTPIEETTYEQRQAALATGKAATEPLLALPFGSTAAEHPPHFVALGERVAPGEEPWRLVDRVLPRLPVHDDYLRQRIALADDRLALVDWCRKSGLDDCAELEASRRMDEIDDFQAPEYARHLERWLALRDHSQIVFSLPLPLEGEWFVLVDARRHHRRKSFAAYAFDIVKKVDNRLFRGDGKEVEDYFGFGEPIVAQADGVVVSVDDSHDDNPPGKIGDDDGNGVFVDYGGGLLGDYAHCRKGSAKVKPGDRVTRGQALAAVGSSGAAGLPHLHFSMVDWGNESIRGRFHGERRQGDRWIAFDGQDLESGTFVRNRAPVPTPTGR
jgi:hypothetical protein